jgi:hypothetical protein
MESIWRTAPKKNGTERAPKRADMRFRHRTGEPRNVKRMKALPTKRYRGKPGG